jgi:hypothetical protein
MKRNDAQSMKTRIRGWQFLRLMGAGWRSEVEQVCAESGLFDSAWYLERNPKVTASGLKPLTHYLRIGAAEGRDPNPLFDTDWYLKQNPNIAASKMNPLYHYIVSGAAQGQDPNPLFDSDWYLARNPDVAAAGMNPLSHYIRWGAAKGFDPSPLFHTSWYLERNPDVAATGMNPLAHYIHGGAAELREPVSSIPKLFQRLAVKPRASSLELRRVLATYSSPPEIAPGKARADNRSQVGVSWAEYFMFKSVERYTHGDLPAALRFSKYAVQTLPREEDPLILYFHIFQECSCSAIQSFTRTFAGCSLLVLHVSHREGISRVERSWRSFLDSTNEIANLIVVGDETLFEDAFSFEAERRILFVPAKDSYEALPQKVAKTLLFLGLCPLDVPIIKVDDDAVCEDLSKLKHLRDGLLRRYDYGGKIYPRASPATCSFWHFGKCTNEEINSKPDGLIWTAPYAGGQGYWLSSDAVSAMSKISLIHERHFEVEYFEDRAIGAALVHYGVRPHHYDLVEAGALRDTSQLPGRRASPTIRLRGSLRQQQDFTK